MHTLSKAALACVGMGTVLTLLHWLLSMQTAPAALFVFGIAYGLFVAQRMQPLAEREAARPDCPSAIQP